MLFAVSDVGVRALLSGTGLTPQAVALAAIFAVAVVLGGVLLREPGLIRRLAAAVLAVGGVALIALG